MATTVKMPPLGESVLEGQVGKWLVREGQRIEREQPVVEILTDKTDSEIPAPVGGVVLKILAAEGSAVAVGGDLLLIDETASASSGSPAPAQAPAAAPTPAAPAAVSAPSAPPASPLTPPASPGSPPVGTPHERLRARELGVDVRSVIGSGRGAVAPPPAAPAPLALPGALPELFKVLGGQGHFRLPPYQQASGDKIVPFDRRRRIIADHMVYSKMTSPHVVTFSECDLQKTHLLREKHKDALKKEGVNLTFLAFVAAATARALRENPVLNARVLDDAYALLGDINLGIAVETPKGLVVPVVRRADELRVRGLARAIDGIAERARTDSLSPDDLAGKTFTISNPGRKGNLVGGAIISQPNVGILRIGEIKKRPVVVERDGEDVIAIHPVMYMALSYDHRIVDGVAANNFLYRVTELLQNGEFEI
ncbi:MAG: dihydrolipoamide acetyltransferase family protein [Deltaproteobacteria bacterium]|jgi:2-oxoglutarate dehydrogenase E2 component (dihydrolipoamide succinyltransferase)